MGFNPIKDLRKLFRKAEHEIHDLSHEAEKGINNLAQQGRHELSSITELGKNELQSTFSELGKQAEAMVEKSMAELKHEAETTFHEVISAIMAELTASTMRKAVDIAQTLAPDTMSLKIGPFGLEIDDVKDRIDTMQRWADHPPNGKDDLKEMIITLAPSSVSVEIDIQFAALIVSSDALEVGFAASWNTESFIEKFDDIVAHF